MTTLYDAIFVGGPLDGVRLRTSDTPLIQAVVPRKEPPTWADLAADREYEPMEIVNYSMVRSWIGHLEFRIGVLDGQTIEQTFAHLFKVYGSQE